MWSMLSVRNSDFAKEQLFGKPSSCIFIGGCERIVNIYCFINGLYCGCLSYRSTDGCPVATKEDQYSISNVAEMYNSTVCGVKHLSTRCNACGLSNNIWICLTCAYSGCGRYCKQHAEQHFVVFLTINIMRAVTIVKIFINVYY